MDDPDFRAAVLALVDRVSPEALETVLMIREMAAELRALRAQKAADNEKGPSNA